MFICTSNITVHVFQETKKNISAESSDSGTVQGGRPTVSCSVQTGGGGGGREYCRLKVVILYFTIVTNFNIVNNDSQNDLVFKF